MLQSISDSEGWRSIFSLERCPCKYSWSLQITNPCVKGSRSSGDFGLAQDFLRSCYPEKAIAVKWDCSLRIAHTTFLQLKVKIFGKSSNSILFSVKKLNFPNCTLLIQLCLIRNSNQKRLHFYLLFIPRTAKNQKVGLLSKHIPKCQCVQKLCIIPK